MSSRSEPVTAADSGPLPLSPRSLRLRLTYMATPGLGMLLCGSLTDISGLMIGGGVVVGFALGVYKTSGIVAEVLTDRLGDPPR